MINETTQQLKTRLNNLDQVRKLRQLITNDRSLARAAFERLSRGQKRCLLIAAGLEHCTGNWDQLDNDDLAKIQLGIKRLSSVVNQFMNCKEEDFIKIQLPETSAAIDQHSIVLKERVALVKQITEGSHYAE
ncbi:hypothetical protein RHO15_05955 [Utexia brackfieldae]|uniref:hypothetical protein n=1 Tax=Utexia brackfieldae TaxID=3074108 RepID=UPI00370DD33D